MACDNTHKDDEDDKAMKIMIMINGIIMMTTTMM